MQHLQYIDMVRYLVFFLELQFQLMMSGVDMDTVRSGEILSRLEHENDIEREWKK